MRFTCSSVSSIDPCCRYLAFTSRSRFRKSAGFVTLRSAQTSALHDTRPANDLPRRPNASATIRYHERSRLAWMALLSHGPISSPFASALYCSQDPASRITSSATSTTRESESLSISRRRLAIALSDSPPRVGGTPPRSIVIPPTVMLVNIASSPPLAFTVPPNYAAVTPTDQKKTDGTRVPSVACSPFQKHSARVLTPPRCHKSKRAPALT